MKDRIRQIMESQHMTQQVFADSIGLGAATLSSIFNGRTRPTLNVVEAIKKKIPNISVDWLVFGTGEMYQDVPKAGSVGEKQSDREIPNGESRTFSQSPMLDFDVPVAPTPQSVVSAPQFSNSVKSTHQDSRREEVKMQDKPQRRVVEIRVFYDDQTWESFSPAKK